jgi:predicted secreted hydrolase
MRSRELIPCIVLAICACRPEAPRPAAAPATDATSLLAGSDFAGYVRAVESTPLRFPADHNSHPDFRTEWWYFTGNLEDAGGRRFGFQLTFFRYALAPEQTVTPGSTSSPWRTRQAWMGHLALTDAAARRFISAQRFSRGSLGLAGNTAEPYSLRLEDWSATASGSAAFPLLLRAATEDASLALTLVPEKGPVPHGDNGLDRKGPEPGNASYYYSMPRLRTTGELRIGESRFTVEGRSWMDREWSTSALGSDLEGWDWLALQLSDGRDLMFYRLRSVGGGTSPFSGGTLIDADGGYRALRADEVELRPLDYWTSPASGARYPVRWEIGVPAERLTLVVEALIPNQEMNLAIRYWEGAVTATGSAADRELNARGYLELTGY